MARKGNPISVRLDQNRSEQLKSRVQVLLAFLLLFCLFFFFSNDLFFAFLAKAGFAMGGRALTALLLKMGCSAGFALAAAFALRALLGEAYEPHMMVGGEASSSTFNYPQVLPGHPVVLPGHPIILPGHPQVLPGYPIPPESVAEAMVSPFYYSTQVHIPGEIEDPLTIDLLSELNGRLLRIQLDVTGRIEGGHVQSIQRELDLTPPEALPSKLQYFILREKRVFDILTGKVR